MATTYKVEIMRSKLIGGSHGHDELEKLLNTRTSEGWSLRQIIATEVNGRIGPGGTEGLMIVFERHS